MKSKGPCVLIVDEDQDILEMVSSKLGHSGKECAVAKSIEFAQGMTSVLTFDLVLLDIPLEGKAGIEMLTGLRRKFPECTLVIMTVFNDANMAIAAMQEGIMDYIVKPFDLDDLDRRIDKVLGRSGAKLRAKIEPEAKPIVLPTRDNGVAGNGYDRLIGGLKDIAGLMDRLEGEIQKARPREPALHDDHHARLATRRET